MKHIDEARLETDSAYRFGYVAEFMGFGEEDIAVIHGAAPLLAPVVPALVDAVYDKLQGYDATWRHFVPAQAGLDLAEGATNTRTVATLAMDDEHIQFRKQHLGRYLAHLVTAPYDGKMVAFLDMVGKMHTPKAGNKNLDVPLVQMNALMGFVHDAINATILGFDIPADAKAKAIRAFSKLLWIQSDFITRHYAH
ncbi:hypothetical protein EON83_23960 [bacterium]|nr:MAG: hypothetical protein EON83_23960 [bacterium]